MTLYKTYYQRRFKFTRSQPFARILMTNDGEFQEPQPRYNILTQMKVVWTEMGNFGLSTYVFIGIIIICLDWN